MGPGQSRPFSFPTYKKWSPAALLLPMWAQGALLAGSGRARDNLVPLLSQGVAGPWEQAEPGCQGQSRAPMRRLPPSEWSQRWEASSGPVLQLAVLDPPAPGKAAVRGQGAV